MVGVEPSLRNHPAIWWLPTNGEERLPTTFANLLLLAPSYLQFQVYELVSGHLKAWRAL